MRDQLISVIIAERPYRLTVRSEEEEEIFRKAASLLADKMQEYAKNYAFRDKQDLLAMVNLQFAVEYVRLDNTARDHQVILDRLQKLEAILDEGLETKG